MAVIAQGQKTLVDLNDPIQQGSAPATPVQGMQWLDTSQSPPQLKRWSGSEWEIVNDVEVGATNLASRSMILTFGSCAVELENYTYTLDCAATAYDGCGLKIDESIFEAGKSYVLSFKICKDSGTLVGIGGHSGAFTTKQIVCDGNVTSGSWSDSLSLPNDMNTHTQSVYFMFSGGTADNALYIQPNRGHTSTSGAYMARIWGIQVERGNVATDWAPSPDDIQENVELQQTDTRSQITSTAAAIRQEVEANYALSSDLSTVAARLTTVSEQTDSNFTWTAQQLALIQSDMTNSQSEIAEQLENVMTYMNFGTSGLTIGKSGNPVTVLISNDRISFMVNGGAVAYFSDNKLYVENGEFLGSLKLGRFSFVPQINGNLSFIKVS